MTELIWSWKAKGWIEEVGISLDDGAFLRGEGVFETLLAVDGQVQFWSRHWERLAKGAVRFGISLPACGDCEAGVMRLLAGEEGLGVGRVRLRLTLSSGVGGRGCLVISAIRAEPVPKSMGLMRSPFVRNERSPLVGVKAVSYAENVLALRAVREQGADEALFANSRGEVAEGARCNVFFIKGDGVVVTPPLSSGCLPGIVRGVLLERAETVGVKVVEAVIRMEEVLEFESCFLTNSILGLCPVCELDGRKVALPNEGVLEGLRGVLNPTSL